ncbi:hypothetical protein NEF87_003280 [Candidatus Lokiarchaeum ossiferum]|uniref:HTH hxlR-type domain-containing protein n=1 Tax=Candidatus Lokiarchaeum ossiferum TaxID=2951803 RepID=A0ABY6HTZ2_9ARCH|nr:hypothetical protein NEF87_003280 [Candidatus Lokiarchaeum sp. B-35]
MTYPMEKRIEEMQEMINLIPKMQNAVKNGLSNHFLGLHNHDSNHVEAELQSLRKAIEILDSKYVLDIIFILSREEEKLYFNEIKQMLSYVNVGTLSKRLKSLEKDKIINRTVFPNQRPIRVSYNLTKLGHGIFRLLLPLLVYVTYFDEFQNQSLEDS